jgi:hypothetical protein
MSRTKSAEKPRQNLQRSKRTRSSPKSDKSAFFSADEPAPAFPADIIIAAPKRARAKSPQIPLAFVAEANVEAKPPLARKPRSTQLKTTTLKTTTGQTTKAQKSAKLKAKTASTKPRAARRKAPAKASIAPEIAQSDVQIPPLETVRLAPPATASTAQSKILVDTTDTIKPLPRSAAVTAYRKNNPFDSLGYWLRSQGRSLAAFFKRPQPVAMPKTTIAELNRLRLENIALQQRIETLLAEQGKAP